MKKKVLDKLETFHSDLEVEKLLAIDHGNIHAIVEAPRDVIEYINRGVKMLKAFDRVGYCLYQGAVVCETGKKQAVLDGLEGERGTNHLSPHELRAIK